MNEAFERAEDLVDLARALGVATSFEDAAGSRVLVSEDTVIAVLAALGVDARSAASRAAAREELRLRDWRRMLPPVFIATQGREQRLWVHVPHGDFARAWVELEDGSFRTLTQMDVWVDPVEVDGRLIGEASFALPPDLPLGWHVVCATDGRTEQRSPLVVTPERLTTADMLTRRGWGFMAQLYAVRSSTSWGLGDLHDAAVLATWSASQHGADFLLVNPLHAACPVPVMAPSPYFPATRQFVNPVYVHIEDIPEFRRLSSAVRGSIDAQAGGLQALTGEGSPLDRDRVWAAKVHALAAIFATGRTPERERAFEAFRRSAGAALRDFATWCVLCEMHGGEWLLWPAELRDPRHAAVAAFRARNSERVTFYEWLQWVLDEQLAATQQQALAAGMSIGMMHDLAVGVDPHGADAWAMHPVLATGVTVGAPPDMYNQVGQDWKQPPWHPQALADAAFIPFRDMLRSALRHAGGLRIDHVLGLFRLWWIPQGHPPSAGTFVSFDHDALLGILCLEAQRAGAVIVGEDLGTMEPWVQQALARRGILGTVISWFEQDADGQPTAPQQWRSEALAAITTHDLPPTAGYLRDEHVRLRASLGLLLTDQGEERERAARDRAAWAQVCRAHGWLDVDVDVEREAGRDEFVVALHRALSASSSVLVGVGLPDAVGDRRAQNQPGTDREYPNWCLPLADATGREVSLDELIGPDPPSSLVPILRAIGGRQSTLAPQQTHPNR